MINNGRDSGWMNPPTAQRACETQPAGEGSCKKNS